jgi:hypothetical protein
VLLTMGDYRWCGCVNASGPVRVADFCHGVVMLSDPPAELAALTARWRDLALKRRAHFIELYETGRWRHYYTEPEFAAELRKLTQMVGRWSDLARDTGIDLQRIADGVPDPAAAMPPSARDMSAMI